MLLISSAVAVAALFVGTFLDKATGGRGFVPTPAEGGLVLLIAGAWVFVVMKMVRDVFISIKNRCSASAQGLASTDDARHHDGTAGDPSRSENGLQHNQKREDNNESFVADVGPHDAHDGHRQQNKNKAQSGDDSWREHVELQSVVSGAQ